MCKQVVILFFLLALATDRLGAQSQVTQNGKMIQIRHAESLSYDAEKNNAKVLRGNVQCEHEGALLTCDTAYIYEKENKMVARGHILITKGDSIRVTGDNLVYEGKSRLATLNGNVKCVEKDMTLTTGILTFDVARSIANYYNGGTIVNRENTLVSKNGHYYSSSKEAAFHYDVVLTNPDYRMNSDTMKYRMTNKTSYFLGPSIITSSNNKDYIYCENGWYNTDKEKAQFSKNAVLVTAQQKLRGDSMTYDRILQVGKAFRNVTLTDTSQKSIIYGDYIEYHQLASEALVTKKAIYARVMDKDTLFIGADTLYHKDIDSVNNFLNAYHHVRIYKKDLQALSDSVSMNTRDSVCKLYYSPILWSKGSQATSKNISIYLGQNKVRGFLLDGKAFLVEAVDSLKRDKFNQLSGRSIEGTITNDTIRKVVVLGNAEVLYFPKNKKKVIGLDKTTCTEIHMWFEKGDVSKITMKPNANGVVDPISKVDLQNARLKGFNWQEQKKPRSKNDLHKR